ncbi:hypothetical protein BGZ92_007142, partial [Podila epicladia]
MADNHLKLFCLVEGEPIANAFLAKASSTDAVGDLKDHIKTKKSSVFDDIPADILALWWVHIPDDNHGSAITIDAFDDKAELNNPRSLLSKFFPESPDDDTYIIVRRPPP